MGLVNKRILFSAKTRDWYYTSQGWAGAKSVQLEVKTGGCVVYAFPFGAFKENNKQKLLDNHYLMNVIAS